MRGGGGLVSAEGWECDFEAVWPEFPIDALHFGIVSVLQNVFNYVQ